MLTTHPQTAKTTAGPVVQNHEPVPAQYLPSPEIPAPILRSQEHIGPYIKLENLNKAQSEYQLHVSE